MAIFLLIFAVCFLVIGSMVGIMMLTRTPRYRTDAHDLLTLFDKALAGTLSETEWHSVIGYPVRHDEFLEGVRRRAQHLMDEHGRPWQAAQGGSLFSRTGREDLKALRDHLASRTALQETRENHH
ncbi:hypothetical protein [Onishia taeanensis]